MSNALKMAQLIEQLSNAVGATHSGYRRYIAWTCLICDIDASQGWEELLRPHIEAAGISFEAVLERQNLIAKLNFPDDCDGRSRRELIEIIATLLDEQGTVKA